MKYKRKYDDILTEEMFLREYVQNKKSAYVLAKELNIHSRTIYYYLDYLKIPKQDLIDRLNIGDKFGKLTIINNILKDGCNTAIWECMCECGKTTILPADRVKSGKTKSCGCINKEKREKSKMWKGFEEISGVFLNRANKCASVRNIKFDLTPKQIWEKYLNQEKKCYLSGINLFFADAPIGTVSIDRINNEEHYYFDNIGLCHKDINKMKLDFTKEYFINICNLITNFNGKFKKIYEIPDIYKTYFNSKVLGAKYRNKLFDISVEDIQKVYCKQGGVCAFTGIPLTFPKNNKEFKSRIYTASIDRIDNKIGYKKNNIQIVHKKINNSRKDLTIERYKELCKMVTEFNIKTT